jgi:hypothetical protein
MSARKKQLYQAAVLATLILVVHNIPNLLAGEHPEPEVLEEAEIRARFVGFFAGDYVYAAFCTPNDSLVSFMLYGNADADYFVAAHIGSDMHITYQVLKSGVREAGDWPIEVLVSARINDMRSDSWWESVSEQMGWYRAGKVFNALVDSLTLGYDRIDCR